MFENLTNKLENIFSKLKSAPSLTEEQVDSGLKEIKLKVNFARAWASTRRSLLLAGFNIIDEDRNSGKFYLEYNFRRSVFSRTPSLSKVEILVSEKNKDECIISTDLGIENLDISEEIISQINQALS